VISVFTHTLWGYRVGIALTALGLFAINLLIVYTFEAFGGMEAAEQFEKLIPESLKGLFKAQGGFATNADGFLAADYRHPIYLVAVSALVIALSSGAVAKEIERGTILMLLGCPLSRRQLLTAKTGAIVAGLLAVLLAAWLGTWMGSIVVGITDQVNMTVFLRVQLNMLALAVAIAGYALLISALGSDGGQTTAWTAGTTVGMFFLDFLATLWSPAESLGPLSIFYYYDPLSIARDGGIPWLDISVLLGVGAVGFIAALVVFQRRDIAS
jgi:ABC-2 type transport system permease protein